MPTFLPRHARCGDWFTRCPARGRDAVGRGAVVFRGRAVQGDGDRHSADAGRGRRSWRAIRSGAPARPKLWREAAWLSAAFCRWPAWYAYHYAKTGFLFGNPEYLRYNAEATLTPLRILAAFGASRAAPDRAHEPVCAGADGLCRTAAEPAHRRRGPRPAQRSRRPALLRDLSAAVGRTRCSSACWAARC